MHYYQHNIGDYRRDTAHLSLLEHGVYRQLIDMYYLSETPIPKETQQVFRRLSARTQEEQIAVEIILNEFFLLTDDGWAHKRCDAEIDLYRKKANNSRENGKKGGRPKSTLEPEKTQQVISGYPTKKLNEPEPNNALTNKPINQDKEKIIKKESSQISRPEQVDEQIWNDFLVLRKQKKAPVTQTAINGIERESIKAGITLSEAIELCCQNGWQGFQSEWLHKQQAPPNQKPKWKNFDAADYNRGNDGYGNPRKQEGRIIDINDRMDENDEQRQISYRATF